MASPHVAGAAALYLQGNPTASPATIAAALLNNATTNVVTNPGTGSPNRLLYTGFISPPSGNQAPVSRPAVTCVGMTCTFDGRGSTDDVGIVAYEWHAGEPSIISTQPVFSYTFIAARTRTWSLVVRDAGGLSHSASVTFTVPGPTIPPPVASFTFGCTYLSCTFDGSGSTAQSNATYTWSWGDGTPNGSGATASHSFGAAGNFDVTLTVNDAGGSNSQTRQVSVSAPPVNQAPVARPSVTCHLMTCTFDGTASTDDTGIVAYEWYPGGPSIISTQPVFTFTFSAGKTRTWSLTVRDAGGLSHSASVTFTTPAP
jgi:PKD repeat protein